MTKTITGTEMRDRLLKGLSSNFNESGYTRVVSENKDVIHYEKDGKKFRRIGNLLVEI